MGKIAWVLGAGFSKSLGGPLLPQLFTPASAVTVRNCFPQHRDLYGDDAKLVRTIYRDDSKNRDARGSVRWEDAEEYLDYLDTAQAVDGTARKVLTELISGPHGTASPAMIKRLALTSRRLMAAECSAFLVDADIETERWQPYRRWARKIERGDVVITFNYDLVLEKLAKRSEVQGKFQILPTRLPDGLTSSSVTILKLHGSVNWRRDAQPQAPGIDRLSVVPDDDYFALGCDKENMLLATPGPTKFDNSAGGPLGPLWEAATFALKTADAIVFLGYRFPQTDSAARRILIEAIGRNEKRHLVLHTVLGPNIRSDKTERLKAMLEAAMQVQDRTNSPAPYGGSSSPLTYDLNVHPLWAEDFLDLCEPNRLYYPQPEGS